MAITLHFLFPIFSILSFIFSALHNTSGTSDVRVVDPEEFNKRFNDDYDSLVRDGVIRVYRRGTNIYKFLSVGCMFFAIVTFIWQSCILFNL